MVKPHDVVRTPWCEVAVVADETAGAQEFVRDTDSGAFLVMLGAWVGSPEAATPEAILKRCLTQPLDWVAQSLEGAFVLVFGDTRAKTLNVVTDIGGSCHVYARNIEGGVAVCTSTRALALLGVSEMDPVAVYEFWASGIIYEDRSLWRDVAKIGPARILTISADGKSNERRYWSFAEFSGKAFGLDEASERVGEALKSAARRIAARYPKVLADVTGGYDSRATISGFVAAGVNFAATVSGPEDSADVVVSRQIATTLGVEHYRAESPAIVSARMLEDALNLSDGECELFEYARIAAIHRGHAARGYSASVNGSFGELARGYWWELLFPRIGVCEPLDAQKLSQKRFAAVAFDTAAMAANHRFDFRDHMRAVIERSCAPLNGKLNTLQMDHAYFDLRMQRWQGRLGSSTGHIWPSFSPFMFLTVLAPVIEARPLARWRSLLVRHLLAHIAPQLAQLPLEHGYPAAPATLANLHRFAPVLGHYVGRVKEKLLPRTNPRTPLQSAAALLEELALMKPGDWHMANAGYFDPAAVARLTSTDGLSLPIKRLITLELAARSVAKARSQLGAMAT